MTLYCTRNLFVFHMVILLSFDVIDMLNTNILLEHRV
jgi:hypothetical protein